MDEELMRQAIQLAGHPEAPFGANPRVGCVIATSNGSVIATGFHRGAGTDHAEVVALTAAGTRARGATAYVSLEPCAHSGRTGPCARALIDAGIARVVYAQSDPNPVAAGGAEQLRRAGLSVTANVLENEAMVVNDVWTTSMRLGRPYVTWKYASTLDGRIAGSGGERRQLTGSAAQQDVHELRARVGAIVVGTSTVLIDDPELTVRHATPAGGQPLRVIVGERDLPPAAMVFNDVSETIQLRTHDPRKVLDELAARDIRHVLLESGPTLAGAFLGLGLIDEIRAYLAPIMTGSGPLSTPVGALPGQVVGWSVASAAMVGGDVRIIAKRS